jgi:hypothetical protein
MNREEAFISVWRQVLVENANLVQLEGRSYPVRRTARRRLRQVEFEFAGETLRGIEQNPAAHSRWARLAAAGAKVMQFTAKGRYTANVADGKVTLYDEPGSPAEPSGGRETPEN